MPDSELAIELSPYASTHRLFLVRLLLSSALLRFTWWEQR